MKWKEAIWVVVAVMTTTLVFQYHHWSEEVDRQQNLPIGWCPNHLGRLSRTGDTIPARCGYPTAVTYGYLR